MRLLVSADLHYNHPRSRPLADELIERMNSIEADVLLMVGDTATTADDHLERALGRFKFQGPKLFVAGNHELWTHGGDSYRILHEELPRRLANLGWQSLEHEPFRDGDIGIVGSVGWYDYSFAQPELRIPRRFYEHKVSPGAAERLAELSHLLERSDDLSPDAREIVARWNDGKFVKLGRSDEAFLAEILDRLRTQLTSLNGQRSIVAAVHHLPFRELLPPPHSAQWDFAKAFLGSERIGRLFQQFPNVTHVVCGHSHLAIEAKINGIHAINIGSGYRWKTFRMIDL